MKRLSLFVIIFFLGSLEASIGPKLSNNQKNKNIKTAFSKKLLSRFKKVYKKNKDLIALRSESLKNKKDAVPVLIEVMKNANFPDKNRWVATFTLGQLMGKKSAPFISRFTEHPHWVMRLASLKALLNLRQSKYGERYAKSLKDKSMLVRFQALKNIKLLNLTKFGPQVWSMLYDKKNYTSIKGGKNKRTNIIKTVIKTVGDLKFARAKKPLLKMVQKKKYIDIFNEIDYSLSKIFGKKSPKGNFKEKRKFWKKIALASTGNS